MRKSIVIFGIIMAFILGTLVSAPSVYAPQGEPFMFLQEEVDAINEILMDLLNENRVLHYAQSSTEFLPPHATEAPLDFTLLAKWKIEKTDPNFAQVLVLYDSSVYANMKGNVDIGWYRSMDGTTWESISTIDPIDRPDSFKIFQLFDIQNDLLPKYNYIAFAAANPFDEGDDGEVKDFSGTVTIHLPASESLTRII